MENALTLAAIMGPAYALLGLSLLAYPKVWKSLIEQLRDNHYQLLGIMLMDLVMGLIVINMYNVWAWNVWVIVTLSGWFMLAKAVFYFLAPGSWIKAVLHYKNTELIVLDGVIAVVLGAVLSYYVYLV